MSNQSVTLRSPNVFNILLSSRDSAMKFIVPDKMTKRKSTNKLASLLIKSNNPFDESGKKEKSSTDCQESRRIKTEEVKSIEKPTKNGSLLYLKREDLLQKKLVQLSLQMESITEFQKKQKEVNKQLHQTSKLGLIANKGVFTLKEFSSSEKLKHLNESKETPSILLYKNKNLDKQQEEIKVARMQGTIMDPRRYRAFYQDIHEPIKLKELSGRQMAELETEYGKQKKQQVEKMLQISDELRRSFTYKLFRNYVTQNERKVRVPEFLK